MKSKNSILVIIISIISAIFTIYSPIQDYFQDNRLLEITKKELRVINKSTDKYKNFTNLTGNKNIFTYDTTIIFKNKGNNSIRVNDFTNLDPIVINTNGIINKKNLLVYKKNSNIDHRYVKVVGNTIIMSPFILDKNHEFEISFLNKKMTTKSIELNGVIANYGELKFGIKKTKIEDFFANNIVLLFLIIIIYGLIISIFIFTIHAIEKTYRKSIYFHFLKLGKNPALEKYINKVLQKDYSMNNFAEEYLEHALEINSFCNKNKQLKHLLSIHQSIIESNKEKYSKNNIIESFKENNNITIENNTIKVSQEFQELLNSFKGNKITKAIPLFFNFFFESKNEDFFENFKKLEISLFNKEQSKK